MEMDIDRPGYDFQNFDLAAANPELCRDACNADGNCQAFTYVRPGVQGPSARCWLKNSPSQATPNTCCISGVKGYVAPGPAPMATMPPPAPLPPPPAPQPSVVVAPVVRGTPATPPVVYQPVPVGGPLEQGIDRPGYDFQNFDLGRPDAQMCQRACLDHPTCQSFTYVRPGVQGPSARCWLKNSVPQAVANNCCISGVKAAGGAMPPPGHPGNWDRRDDRKHDDRHDNRRDDRRGDDRKHDDRRHDRRPMEQNMDRPGYDFQNFDLPRPEPELCERSCWDNPTCKAFTFVRPPGPGQAAHCWLKMDVPQAVPNNCCISGVR
jgi:1-phosphatidylinositol phosphodiesterase